MPAARFDHIIRPAADGAMESFWSDLRDLPRFLRDWGTRCWSQRLISHTTSPSTWDKISCIAKVVKWKHEHNWASKHHGVTINSSWIHINPYKSKTFRKVQSLLKRRSKCTNRSSHWPRGWHEGCGQTISKVGYYFGQHRKRSFLSRFWLCDYIIWFESLLGGIQWYCIAVLLIHWYYIMYIVRLCVCLHLRSH